jgi:hypothetical protein
LQLDDYFCNACFMSYKQATRTQAFSNPISWIVEVSLHVGTGKWNSFFGKST